MNIREYADLDGTALAAVVRRGELPMREVTEAAIAAIDAVNPTLNAVVERYADAFDERKLGDGPFRGVPFLIKDVGQQFAGRKAESGSELRAGYVTPANNYYAENVIAAGFNPVGRSNVPEFSMALCADNKLYGATSNPWKPGYSTSGSSGGAAAAVAAGLVPVAHASDIGGSTRGPAAWCGCVGLHPSRGRVSAGPGTGDPGWGMAQSSVVTRSVRDTAAALELLAKPMPGDPYVVARPDQPYTDFLRRGEREIRVGWSANPLMDAPVDPEVAAAVRRTAETLAGHGFIVEEAQPEIDLAAMDEGCKRIWYYGFDNYLDRLGALAGRTVSADTVSRATLRFYHYAREQRADDVLEMLQAFNGMRRAAAAFFTRFDVWRRSPSRTASMAWMSICRRMSSSVTSSGRASSSCPTTYGASPRSRCRWRSIPTACRSACSLERATPRSMC
jgi:amidase